MFKITDTEIVEAHIKKNSFATLVSHCNESGLTATHIPLHFQHLKGISSLTGHISIANGQKEALQKSQEVMAIFMQDHAYISSSWYDHVNVPTWNYIAVHVYGKCRILEGRELYESINQMVNHYEEGRKGRFHLHQFEEKELQAHLNGVVGFEMSMDRIEAAFKLSQNRKDQDYQEIIRQLENTKDPLQSHIANEMRKLRSL
jgi:transcriptional regulator